MARAGRLSMAVGSASPAIGFRAKCYRIAVATFLCGCLTEQGASGVAASKADQSACVRVALKKRTKTYWPYLRGHALGAIDCCVDLPAVGAGRAIHVDRDLLQVLRAGRQARHAQVRRLATGTDLRDIKRRQTRIKLADGFLTALSEVIHGIAERVREGSYSLPQAAIGFVIATIPFFCALVFLRVGRPRVADLKPQRGMAVCSGYGAFLHCGTAGSTPERTPSHLTPL